MYVIPHSTASKVTSEIAQSDFSHSLLGSCNSGIAGSAASMTADLLRCSMLTLTRHSEFGSSSAARH
jgi:hypothetical protein